KSHRDGANSSDFSMACDGFLTSTFVGIGSLLRRSGATALGGWPGLEKIDAPRHRSTRDILGSAARSGDARYHLNRCTHQRAHRRSSGAKRKTLLILSLSAS